MVHMVHMVPGLCRNGRFTPPSVDCNRVGRSQVHQLVSKSHGDVSPQSRQVSAYFGLVPKQFQSGETAQNASSVSAPKEKTLNKSPEPVERVVASKPKERSSRATSSLTGNVKKPGRRVVIDAAEAKVRKRGHEQSCTAHRQLE